MTNYVLYNSAGKILRVGQCQAEDLPLQGEYVIEGVANDSTQYIQDGVVVNMPPKPGKFYVFDYNSKQWAVDETSADSDARSKRKTLFLDSDWTQLADISAATKALWEPYRQALRDITDQPGYPFNIVWPTPPQ